MGLTGNRYDDGTEPASKTSRATTSIARGVAVSDENLLNFEEHRRRAEADPHRVRCARCGKPIPMNATRCPECGVHFRGEAFQFTHAAEAEPGEVKLGTRGLVLLAVILAAVVLAVALAPLR